jgi:hypothetical protein
MLRIFPRDVIVITICALPGDGSSPEQRFKLKILKKLKVQNGMALGTKMSKFRKRLAKTHSMG